MPLRKFQAKAWTVKRQSSRFKLLLTIPETQSPVSFPFDKKLGNDVHEKKKRVVMKDIIQTCYMRLCNGVHEKIINII